MENEEETAHGEWTLARLADMGAAPRLVNVLGHGHVKSTIDVQQLALLVRNADYKPRGFGALVLRFQEPRASLMVYKSGKFVVLGARTPDDARITVDKFIAVLAKSSFPHELVRFTIANVIGSVDLHFRVRLEGLARDHIRFATYEPELFPGLIYRLLEPKATLLIFVSGKVVITGATSLEQMERVVCKMFPVLLQYRVRSESWDSDDSMENAEDTAAMDADDEIDSGDDDELEEQV